MISSTISLLSWQRRSFRSSLSTLGTKFADIFRIFSSSRNYVYNSHTDIKLCTYCLPGFLESFMPLKNWCSIHARSSKSSLKHSIRFSGIFKKSLEENFIANRSSKVSSCPDCIFEIHDLWQSGFSRVYSNCCCSCSFEPEIIKIGQASNKMYSKNILNFQKSPSILNACTKRKPGNLLKAPCRNTDIGKNKRT